MAEVEVVEILAASDQVLLEQEVPRAIIASIVVKKATSQGGALTLLKAVEAVVPVEAVVHAISATKRDTLQESAPMSNKTLAEEAVAEEEVVLPAEIAPYVTNASSLATFHVSAPLTKATNANATKTVALTEGEDSEEALVVVTKEELAIARRPGTPTKTEVGLIMSLGVLILLLATHLPMLLLIHGQLQLVQPASTSLTAATTTSVEVPGVVHLLTTSLPVLWLRTTSGVQLPLLSNNRTLSLRMHGVLLHLVNSRTSRTSLVDGDYI